LTIDDLRNSRRRRFTFLENSLRLGAKSWLSPHPEPIALAKLPPFRMISGA
jgi:hypothetical protein